MNAEMNTVAGSESAAIDVARNDATRPFYWSVRRELWEHRALYIAPLVPAGIMLLFVILGALNIANGMHFSAPIQPEQQQGMLRGILSMLAGVVAVVACVTGFFYCLDALHGERRDRSILFWKSLPVSDLTAVLAKLSIAAIAVPVIVFSIVVATGLVILLIATLVVFANGSSPAAMWSAPALLHMTVMLLYVLVALALWLAPIYGWLLLVSAWARRSTFLWAVMPPLAVILIEKLAFDTGYFALLLRNRLAGGLAQALAIDPRPAADYAMSEHLPRQFTRVMDPANFLASPALWIGLAVAAAFIAAAVWMRRYREPL